MRALITNDDGVESEGIRALARVAVDAGLETVIAAPSWDSSGASASLTSVLEEGRFMLGEREPGDLEGVRVFGAEAAPAYIVRAAATGAFGAPPDIVLSGINRGPNTGHAVLHSGTVGAALTAATFGVPALAVSIDAGPPSVHWETAAAAARIALDWLLQANEPLVLNVNAPNLPLEDVQGFRRTTLAAFGAVQAVVTESGSGYVRLRYDEVDADYQPGTDAAAIAEGFASITAIRAVCEDVDGGLPDAFELRAQELRR